MRARIASAARTLRQKYAARRRARSRSDRSPARSRVTAARPNATDRLKLSALCGVQIVDAQMDLVDGEMARQVAKAVGIISDLGAFEFVDDDAKRKEFEALVSHSSQAPSPPKGEAAQAQPALLHRSRNRDGHFPSPNVSSRLGPSR